MIGMINDLAKFVPQLSEAMQPMKDLLKEDAEFIWDQQQEDALKKAKELILSQSVLTTSNPKEPLLSHEVPSRPWQKLATDIFTWEKRQFLVTVDYYSRFFEVDELTTTTSYAVIRKLSAHFARHGLLTPYNDLSHAHQLMETKTSCCCA